MALPYYEVSVPMRSTDGASGTHTFTGVAESRSAALRIARDTYSAAHAAQRAGHALPGKRPDGWGACGYRPGWRLDWRAATAALWEASPPSSPPASSTGYHTAAS